MNAFKRERLHLYLLLKNVDLMLLLQELLLLPGDLNGDKREKRQSPFIGKKTKYEGQNYRRKRKKYFYRYYSPIKVSVRNGQQFEKVPKV